MKFTFALIFNLLLDLHDKYMSNNKMTGSEIQVRFSLDYLKKLFIYLLNFIYLFEKTNA